MNVDSKSRFKKRGNSLAAITEEVNVHSITTLVWLFLQTSVEYLQMFTQKALGYIPGAPAD